MDTISTYEDKQSYYYECDRHELLPYVPDNSLRILDVGCGAGRFGAQIKRQRKCEIWGVEPNKEPAIAAGQCLDKVIHGMFENTLGLPKATFDLICFNDVLEHMPDPQQALVYARELLKPDGRILVSVPNFRHFNNIWKLVVHGSATYEQSGVMDKTHLRIFTYQSIRNLITDSGYSVDLLEGLNPQYAGRLFKLLNMFLLGAIADMRYLQIVIVAKLI